VFSFLLNVEEIKERAKEYEDLAKELKEVAEKRKKEYKITKEKLEKTLSGRKVFVFMSSSVPLEVWHAYAEQARELGINGDVVFVLRGCIGGCRFIKPTLNFLKNVMEKEKDLEVWIDPLLFRRYKVKVVPCVAVEGKEFTSCGDWSLKWHLEKLGE